MFQLPPDESLLKVTNYKIERSLGSLTFSVYELISPYTEFKFYAFPTQFIQIDKPKPAFVIKGNSEQEVIDSFLVAVRGIPSLELFEAKK